MRPSHRIVGFLAGTFCVFTGYASGSAFAQADLTVGVDSTWPIGDPYLFQWQTGYQVVALDVRANLYCEELPYFTFDAHATLSVGAFTTSSGETRSSFDLGCDYLYSPTTRPSAVFVTVPITPSEAVYGLLTRAARDDSFSVDALIDPTSAEAPFGLVDEGGTPFAEVDNNRAAIAFPASQTFRVLSGKVRFGGVVAQVVSGTGFVAESPSCDSGDFELIGADFELPESAGGGVIDASDYETLCVKSTFDPVFGEYDLEVTGALGGRVRTVMTEIGGLVAKVNVRLTSGGLLPTRVAVQLPAGHTLHTPQYTAYESVATWAPSPRGTRWVRLPVVESGAVGSLGEIVAASFVDSVVVSQSTPLAFRFNTLRITRDGLVGDANETKWLRELPVHSLDSRHPTRGGPRSNDVLFANVGPSTRPIRIDGDGLDGEFIWGDGSGRTAFPRGSLTWTGGTLEVADGALAPQLAPVDNASLDNITSCPGCSSAGGGTRKLLLGRVEVRPGVGPDGSIAVPVRHERPFVGDPDPDVTADDLPSEEIGFGPSVTVGNTTRPTFVRGGAPGQGDIDQLGQLVFAGHVLSKDHSPADSLLGTWRMVSGSQGGFDFQRTDDPRPLTDVETRRGNGFFAGYNIGPEIYSDAQNQPVVGAGRSLAGSVFSIAFPTATAGAPDIRNVPVNSGTKFVVRGAVTGVVNVDAANAPQPQVYGYQLAFSRFAFGLVDNTLAASTWIDGGITVPGHGQFAIPFTSLGLTCTGQLAGGVVDFARMSAQTLRAWKTPWGIESIAFKSTGTDTQCSTNPRQLEVGGQVEVSAMARKLDIAARWTPQGTPGDIKVAPLTTRLDQTETDPGFEVQTAADDMRLGFNPENLDLGWFDFGARLFVPFWESFDVRLRLQNQGSVGALTAAPSLVVAKTFPPAQGTAPPLVEDWATKWRRLGNSELTGLFEVSALGASDPQLTANVQLIDAIKLEAKKSWVFDLKGDVKWRPRTGDLSGRFVAAKEKVNESIPVLKTKTAVPFVTSRNTQYTFGVDADLRKLQDISLPSLKVDLKNPETIKRIDDFLTSTPLNLARQNGLGPVERGLGTLRSAVTDLASSVKSQFGPTLKKVLKKAIDEAFNVSGVGDLLDLGAKAVSAVQSIAQQAVGAVFSELGGLVDNASQALIAGPDAELVTLYNELPAKIVAARGLAQEAKDAARTYLSGTASQTISNARAAVQSAKAFVSQIDAQTAKARTQLGALTTTVKASFDKARCALGVAPPPPGSPPSEDVCAGKLSIRALLDVTKLPYLQCDVDKNPALQQVKILKEKLYAVIDKLAATGDSGLNKLVTDLGKKLPAVNGQKFDTDGLAKTFIQLGETAKWLKEKIDRAYNRVVGWPPNASEADKKIPTFCGTIVGSATPKLKKLETELRGFVDTIQSALGTADFTVTSTLSALASPTGPVAKLQGELKSLLEVLDAVDTQLVVLDNLVQGTLADNLNLEPLTVQEVQDVMNGAARKVTKLLGAETPWLFNGNSFLTVVANKLTEPVYLVLGKVESAIGAELAVLLKQIPLPKKEDLLNYLTNLVVESEFTKDLITLVTDNLSFLEDKANEMVNLVLDQLTLMLQHAIDLVANTVGGFLKSALDEAKGAVASFPIQAAKIKGAAQINAQELELLHISAEFTTGKSSKPEEQAQNDKTKEAKSATSFAAEPQGRLVAGEREGRHLRHRAERARQCLRRHYHRLQHPDHVRRPEVRSQDLEAAARLLTQ